MPSVQKKIRDLERVIKRNPNAASPELHSRLQNLYDNKKRNEQSAKEARLSRKYHMVKFVERKKLVRRILKIDAAILSSNSEVEKERLLIQRDLQTKNLEYVLYYPKDMKYVALLVTTEEKDGDEEEEEEEGVSHDAKTQKISERARILAAEARQRDIEAGNIDKVQHAIDVGLNSDSSSNHKKQQRELESFPIEDGSSDDNQIEAGSSRRGNKRSEAVVAAAAIGTGSSGAIKHLKSPSTADQPIAEERDDDDDGSDGNEDEVDDFFVEEMAEPSDTSSLSHRVPQARISTGAMLNLRSGQSDRKQQWGRQAFEDDPSLTKQELRLRRWQAKVRGKGTPLFSSTNTRRSNSGRGGYGNTKTSVPSSVGVGGGRVAGRVMGRRGASREDANGIGGGRGRGAGRKRQEPEAHSYYGPSSSAGQVRGIVVPLSKPQPKRIKFED